LGAFSSPAQSNLDMPSLTFPAAEVAFQATAKSLDETATLLPPLSFEVATGKATTGSTPLENVLIGQNGASDGNGNRLKPISNQPPNNVGYGFRFLWYGADRRNRRSMKHAMK